MDYISTTDLRTKSSQLITSLLKGMEISLIHRSKVVGVIKPVQKSAKPLTQEDIDNLKKLAKEQNAPKTSYKERERIYRKHLEEKYGKDLS
ncbi:MAG: hypothetical protein A3H50_03150 [Candidatus Levybacteria bacterium RIFCSPLOWO2_02_FULL_37_10]|nr:MAG: hypothetical protein A2860_00825 [Candidatus Levybacteria bacterium RIFCSPHIGHO2_01_FULL_37_33]OGH16314.1 MAG: hypothetical protein A3C97_03135 [Candidatus Levybacteria bacterium RIFCSPHIGHO2_02_FULL_37_11]OGH32545.1 MAG: hypothetical protein A2953_00265 [Candidatus Levybacteria bacterium RIFCSPLOWO2_01_FULL_36_54]OGH43404.1 MAG: hypothetical protein A3H50_03150 [Candidatus Levybacteria bacterium RIFCSPLOWO2_02_FULL_37_10]